MYDFERADSGARSTQVNPGHESILRIPFALFEREDPKLLAASVTEAIGSNAAKPAPAPAAASCFVCRMVERVVSPDAPAMSTRTVRRARLLS